MRVFSRHGAYLRVHEHDGEKENKLVLHGVGVGEEVDDRAD